MTEKITLPNGVRILCEHIEHVRSASVGIWVGSGSRHEPPELNGISHFIEHIVFKGTQTRSAADIAADMDSIGGQVNAFTTKECTCFYARALDKHLMQALDVLCDMFFEPKIAPADVKMECGVILEEIGMYEDSPEDLVSERLFSAVYKGTPLEYNILGRPGTLKKLTAARIRRYIGENYSPYKTVVAVSGSFTDADIDYLRARFSGMTGPVPSVPEPAGYTPAFTVRRKPIEQNHLCIGFPAPGMAAEQRHTLQILSLILGGGMSSRLFQSVREQRGLCYSIYSFAAAHEDTGIFGIYTALGSQTEQAALALICEELARFVSDGPTADELDRAREQITAGVLMSLESTNARMNHLARSELYLGHVPTAEEIIEKFDAVTLRDVRALCQEMIGVQKLSFSAVGRVHESAKYRALLSWK